MPKIDFPKQCRAAPFWLAIVLAVVFCDQLSKAWVVAHLIPSISINGAITIPLVEVIPYCLRFEYAENPGAAFSLFYKHPEVLTVLASFLAVAVSVWCFLMPREEKMARISLGMILGGAIGNLIDRYRYEYVVDFIVAYVGKHQWPTFNIADTSICIGIGIFFIASWLHPQSDEEISSDEEKQTDLEPDNS